MNDMVFNESIGASVGKAIRGVESDYKLSKAFKSFVPNIHKHCEKELSDNDLKEAKELEKTMRTVEDWPSYKQAFSKFIGMFHIKPTIIYSIKYDKNKIDIKYEDMDKDMVVPKGSTLTHISPNEFGELKPSFRSKTLSNSNASRGGYLYSSPRVYVTLHSNSKSSAKSIADIKQGSKIVTYTIPEKISMVKVDPAIRNNIKTGAAYIETILPIKVHRVDSESKKPPVTNNKTAEDVTRELHHNKEKSTKLKKYSNTKESVNDAKFSIYYAYEHGLIEKFERDDLLSILQ